MSTSSSDKSSSHNEKYKVWFFAGGETRDNRFNVFTASFIKLMKEIMGNDFEFIKGIYYKSAMLNVIWALNNAQKPISYPEANNITSAAFRQIVEAGLAPNTQLIITSSSSGSIVAAQTACYLALKNKNNVYFQKPFHIALGSSMISDDSELFHQLIRYQKEGTIGEIIHADLQDEGDSSAGIGGLSKKEAFSNAFGLMFPWFSKKFSGPSFLNTHPKKGHIHRRRSKTIHKAIDYLNVILVKYYLAGEYYREKAEELINRVNAGATH